MAKIIDGVKYHRYGTLSEGNHKDPSIEYGLCWFNILIAVCGSPSIILPFIVVCFLLWKPLRKKPFVAGQPSAVACGLCQKTISSQAAACPHCGHPNIPRLIEPYTPPEKKSSAGMVTAVFGVIGILVLGATIWSFAQTSPPTESPEQVTEPPVKADAKLSEREASAENQSEETVKQEAPSEAALATGEEEALSDQQTGEGGDGSAFSTPRPEASMTAPVVELRELKVVSLGGNELNADGNEKSGFRAPSTINSENDMDRGKCMIKPGKYAVFMSDKKIAVMNIDDSVVRMQAIAHSPDDLASYEDSSGQIRVKISPFAYNRVTLTVNKAGADSWSTVGNYLCGQE